MRTSMVRWGATPVPSASGSVVCPMPTAVSYAQVKAAFDKAKKTAPQLTPAAWRKMAAQELGMPYDDYLAIWKTKGKVPMVPASTPTHPVSAGVQATKAQQGQATVAMKSVASLEKDVDDLYQAYLKGDIDKDDFYEGIGYINKNIGDYPGVTQSVMDKVLNGAANKLKVKAPMPSVPVAPQVAGGANYQTVKAAYDLMKKQMPGATPAQIRKAAAKHLGMDYNDFLKAWKNKPGKTPGVGSVPKGAPKSPAPTSAGTTTGPNVIPLHPSTVGKYGSSDITAEQLKDELARLFGPKANKSYINLSFDEISGTYNTTFPSSILNEYGKKQVAEGLKKLGLKVDKKSNGSYDITPGKPKVAKPGKFTKQDASGNTVINQTEAQRRTDAWWRDLDKDTQKAWNYYTGSGYRGLNQALRGIGRMTDDMRKHSKALSDSMEAVEDQFTVVRGGGYDIEEFKGKSKWTSEGFTSTAASGGFGGNVRFVITVSKGTKGRWIGTKSVHPGEKEFLLDKGTEFRITSIDDSKHPPVVHLTTIPKKK